MQDNATEANTFAIAAPDGQQIKCQFGLMMPPIPTCNYSNCKAQTAIRTYYEQSMVMWCSGV
jgi:hypothetical protein